MSRKKFIVKSKEIEKSSAGILSYFKLGDSYTNLILGAIVVIAIGIALIAFLKNNNEGQTSSTVNGTSTEDKSDAKTLSTYTVKAGDSLWSISEQLYKSGYEWKEIAKANNLENPSLIHVGKTLKLPKIDNEIAIVTKQAVQGASEEKAVSNNSITESKYTVKKGDNLWSIAVRAYGDGFRYGEIAKANNLVNPRLIHSSNVLIIPRK